MHHFSKHLKKKFWYHIFLPIGSALVTVAILDIIACFSWLCKDHGAIMHFTDKKQNLPFNVIDILYWIFVTYRVVLSLLLCICGIFMGRRVVVVVWLIVSMMIDLVHLSQTIFVISKPSFVNTWPLFLAVGSSIWGEFKIIHIKYRIIRRTVNADWNNNFNVSKITSDELNTSSCDQRVQTNVQFENSKEPDYDEFNSEVRLESFQGRFCIKTSVINFIKLARNLYNLLTWHFTGFLFGGDFQKLLNNNNTAVFLEQNLIRHARIFLDALTVIYILQEKKLFVTPWIAIYILCGSTAVAIFLFILLHLNLMTSLFITIYYSVFSIDLFFRSGFLLYCIRLIVKKRQFFL